MQPRLGPKPFSSVGSGEVSFDKVFSVPQAPGSGEEVKNGNGHPKTSESPELEIDDQRDSDEKEESDEFSGNGEAKSSIEKSDSLEEDLQKAISTAERRKVRFKYPPSKP